MSKCCVNRCENAWKRGENTSVTFHRFPSNPQLRQEWMSALDISTPALSEQETVCSEHLPMRTPVLSNNNNLAEFDARSNARLTWVCRACLATDIRMYDMRQAGTLSAYCALLGLDTTDIGLPKTICYECSERLRKLQSFTASALRANNYLLQMLHSQGEIIENEVRKVDRDEMGLISPLKFTDIISLNLEAHNDCKYQTIKIECGVPDGTESNRMGDYERIVDAAVMPKFIVIDEVPIETHTKMEVEEDDLFFDGKEVFPRNDELELADTKADLKPVKINVEKEKIKRKPPKKKMAAKKIIDKNADLKRGKDAPSPIAADGPAKKRKRRTGVIKGQEKKNYSEDYPEFFTVTVMTDEESAELLKARRLVRGYASSAYRCEDCHSPFVSLDTYEKHRLRHGPSAGDQECGICKLRMKSRDQLMKHKAMCHRTKFVCKQCPYVCTMAQLARYHIEKHSKKTYRCQECNRSFKVFLTYKMHMYKQHPTEQPCPACGASYLGRDALRAHVAQSHADEADAAGSARCSDCAVDFHSEAALQRHRATSIKHNAAAPQLSCEVCELTFPDRESAAAHRGTHRDPTDSAGQTAMACELCGKQLAGSLAYHHHFKREHRGATRTLYPAKRAPSMCELCGRAFQNQTHLIEHMRLHTGERPFRCDICDKTFARVSMQRIHMRTHTKERPYKCDECGRTFTTYSNMHRHKKEVHSEARPYSCDICSKTFKIEKTLDDHVKYVHLKTPWPKRDRSKRGARPAAGPEAPRLGASVE